MHSSILTDMSYVTSTADTIEASDGVHILDAIEWDSSDDDIGIYLDSSLNSLVLSYLTDTWVFVHLH